VGWAIFTLVLPPGSQAIPPRVAGTSCIVSATQ
jgi:hypothetical protein